MEEEVIDWNLRFPIDRWWRKKYNIPYNSPAHRESNFLDQLFEFEEEKLFNKIENEERSKREYLETGKWWREPEFNSEKERALFEKSEAKNVYDEFPDEIEIG